MTNTPKPTTTTPDATTQEGPAQPGPKSSEDAFRKFLENVELDEDDEKAIKERIAQVSGEGEPLIDDDD